MLSKIKQALESFSDRGPGFNPATLNDPVALQTAWRPAKRGGTNFRTHKRVDIDPHRCEFRATPGIRLFSLLFLVVGLGIAIGFWVTRLASGAAPELNAETLVPTAFGLIFVLVGGVFLYNNLTPIVFDRQKGFFWKGRKAPDQVFNPAEIKTCAALDTVHALQLLREYCRGNKSSYYSYELNLVLRDGTRLNVIDHGNLKALREDAAQLGAFLGKPVWDAT